MIHEIILPMLGETMDSGQITAWRNVEGDKVVKGEPLFEVTTDKAAFEAESPADGYLRKILCPVSEESVPVAKVIGYISDKPDEALPELPEGAASAEPAAAPAPEPVAAVAVATETLAVATAVVEAGGRIKISPLARKLAGQHSLDLEQLRGMGSGPGGRIVKKDVLALAESAPAVAALQAVQHVPVEKPVQATSMTRMRKAIARRLLESKQTIPHYYLTTKVRVDEMVKMRKDIITEVKKLSNVRLTYTDLIVKAVGIALIECPSLNATFDGEQIHYAKRADVGLAVAVPDGLVVPVVRGVDTRPLTQIVSERAKAVAKARSGKLTPQDMTGGTFTVTNLGTLPVDQFAAIINPPEVGILAVGRIAKAPIVDDNENVVVESVMYMTLSADHRVVDGAVGAEFLGRVTEILESPYLLLRHGL